MSIEEKERLLNQQSVHLRLAQEAREYMNESTEKAKAAIGDLRLGPHPHCSGPDIAHYGFDYAQQVCL